MIVILLPLLLRLLQHLLRLWILLSHVLVSVFTMTKELFALHKTDIGYLVIRLSGTKLDCLLRDILNSMIVKLFTKSHPLPCFQFLFDNPRCFLQLHHEFVEILEVINIFSYCIKFIYLITIYLFSYYCAIPDLWMIVG